MQSKISWSSVLASPILSSFTMFCLLMSNFYVEETSFFNPPLKSVFFLSVTTFTA